MEEHTHNWVAGMMHVNDEDLAEIAQKREVECQFCEATVRISWHIEFADRLSATVYNEDMARMIVTGDVDPRSFVPGEVTSITKHVLILAGSHDDNSRHIEYLSSEPVDFEKWSK